MKSINKNKLNSAKKYLKSGESPKKQSHRYGAQQPHSSSPQIQFVDQMIEFHLTDEQPQSLMAKRKLQEFSVQLDEEAGVSAFKRNQNSINMHRVSRNAQNADDPREGWVEDQLRTTHKSQPDSTDKHKRSQSASQCTIRQTLKIRTQQQKKFSFTSTPLQNNKLNLSFNNLSPFHMETIPEAEISKQLVKKVKSHSSRRPITALYYGASQKVLTLFEKQPTARMTKRNHPSDTMRIHSNKQVDPKVLGWRENKFLKTFSFSAINHNNNKSASRSKRGSQKVQSNSGGGTNNGSSQKENNQNVASQPKKQRYSYVRTCSQVDEEGGLMDKTEKQAYGPYSQRKLVAMSQKRYILSKRIKSHGNIVTNNGQEEHNSNQQKHQKQQQQKQKIRQRFSHQSNLIGNRKPIPTTKIQPHPTTNLPPPPQPQTNSLSPTKPTPLQHDFSLLLSLLKHQSHNIFGGQLHNYLTQMKNNSLYNYYYSGVGKKNKKNGKLVLNTGKRGMGVSQHDRRRGLIEEKKKEEGRERSLKERGYKGLSVVREKMEAESGGEKFVRAQGREGVLGE